MKNKNIVIVGGTDGIGRALADLLAPENRVLIIGRSKDKGERFVQQHGGNAQFIATDISLLNNIPRLVNTIKTHHQRVDFILHTADILRVKRLDTSEGLEKSIATNYYSRVLFNQLMIGEAPIFRPERIIHIAAAGFPPLKGFIKSFPLPVTASSFKGHGIGQLSNDFYALLMKRRLKAMDIKINVLNPGMVDTDIRRNGQFPKLIRWLSPIVGLMLAGKVRQPEDYAAIPLSIINQKNPDADKFTLINSKGKGITGNKHVNDQNIQEELYEITRNQINEKLKTQEVKHWL